MQDTVYDYLGEAHTIDGFRDMYPTFFELVYTLEGTPVTASIKEPINWDDTVLVLQRHPQYHGFSYEVLDNFALASDCPAGKAALIAMYKKYGADAHVLFQTGVTIDEETKIIEHQGKLNMNTFQLIAGKVTCDVEAYTLQHRLQAKADVKLNLTDSKALDGSTVTAPNLKGTVLHSKAFKETFQITSAKDEADSFTVGDADIWVFPNLSNPAKSDIKTIHGNRPFGISFINPLDVKDAFWKAFSDGTYTVTVDIGTIHFELYLKQKPFALNRAAITSFYAQPYLVQERDGAVLQKYRIGDGNYNRPEDFRYGPLFAWFTVQGSASNTLTIRQGDNVYLYVEIKYTYKGANELATTQLKAQSTDFSLQIDGVSRNLQSSASGLYLYDAVQQAIRLITGQNDCFRSSLLGKAGGLYGTDGDAANYLLLNGFGIRGFVGKPPQKAYKELLEDINAVFGIGYEYTVESGTPIVRMEKAEYFYRGGEIMEIAEISGYGMNVAKEYLYSTLQIGYSKYLEEGLNFLDEFNAYHEYSTPIQTEAGRYQVTSNLITSGYAIEATRREQFESTPKDSTRFDDDLFLVAVNPASVSYQGMATFTKNALLFAGKPVLLLPTRPKFMENGIQFTVSGTMHHNTSFTAVLVFMIGTETVVLLDKQLLPGEVALNATLTPTQFAGYAERNEYFDVVENLLEPETAYNLRLTPKRNLSNHGPWLSSCLNRKADSEVYKNTFVKMNGELVTQRTSTDNFPFSDPDRLRVIEKADVPIGHVNRGKRIFSPEWITFSCRLTRSEYNTLRNALRGWNNDATDYGYITVTDPDGEKQSGYPFEIRWQRASGKAQIKMLQTFGSFQQQNELDCSQYAGWTFAQFETAPPSQQTEKCLMSLFL